MALYMCFSARTPHWSSKLNSLKEGPAVPARLSPCQQDHIASHALCLEHTGECSGTPTPVHCQKHSLDTLTQACVKAQSSLYSSTILYSSVDKGDQQCAWEWLERPLTLPFMFSPDPNETGTDLTKRGCKKESAVKSHNKAPGGRQPRAAKNRAHLCQSPERLQPPGNGAGKAAFPAEGRENEAVLRPVRLICAVGAAKLLNGLVSAPGKLVGQVNPLPLVLRPPAHSRDIKNKMTKA